MIIAQPRIIIIKVSRLLLKTFQRTRKNFKIAHTTPKIKQTLKSFWSQIKSFGKHMSWVLISPSSFNKWATPTNSRRASTCDLRLLNLFQRGLELRWILNIQNSYMAISHNMRVLFYPSVKVCEKYMLNTRLNTLFPKVQSNFHRKKKENSSIQTEVQTKTAMIQTMTTNRPNKRKRY